MPAVPLLPRPVADVRTESAPFGAPFAATTTGSSSARGLLRGTRTSARPVRTHLQAWHQASKGGGGGVTAERQSNQPETVRLLGGGGEHIS